jgi:inhibitor of KinA sporulation pathway (predicted exonuclease)
VEATCWRDRSLKHQNEIIEIGAVKINDQQETIDEFNAFIKPKLHPELSDFCTELTTIEQSDIDQADSFEAVITDFWNWIDIDEDYVLCSWGFYDRSQFKKDCELNKVETAWLKPHISLKHQYAEIKNLRRPMGMGGALKKERIPLEGTHHRGIDDAKNISKIFLAHFNSWKF